VRLDKFIEHLQSLDQDLWVAAATVDNTHYEKDLYFIDLDVDRHLGIIGGTLYIGED